METNSYAQRPASFYRSLPKVDLHRHLEGSLRLQTLLEIGKEHGLNLPNTSRLRELVQICEDEPFTFQNFLSKFETLRLFYRSPEVIERVTREAIEDAAEDNVQYLELRFTPAALSRAERFPLEEVMDWVVESTQKAAEKFGVKTRLIASVNRHEGPDLAAQVLRASLDRKDRGIVGLDLAGNEVNFSGLLFAGIFKEACQSGLHITIHAGEWGSAQNVEEAIEQLSAERIGHGVRVLEDPQTTRLARHMGTAFEVCITSNYQSGAIPTTTVHPLSRMISLGLKTTINTDDPSISQIRLSDEYYRACEELGLTLEQLRQCVLNAANAAFLPEQEKKELAEALVEKFPL